MKKRNENDPDNLGGLGDLLPAEVLKKVNELLEQLHRAGHINQGSKIELVYVAPGGQHVDNIQSQNIYTYKRQGASEEPASVTPPPEAMARAVERTMAQGYWWASTAWAVVYRVYQMKGYTGGIRQFVREVGEWPFCGRLNYECNYDAVCKPIRSGRLTGTPDGWVKNGATAQYAILGTALLKELP
jgi:hypothetical protein